MTLRDQPWWPEFIEELQERSLEELAGVWRIDVPRAIEALVATGTGGPVTEEPWWPEAVRVSRQHGIRQAARVFDSNPRRIRRGLAREGERVAGRDVRGEGHPELAALRERLGNTPDHVLAEEAGLPIEAIQGERRRLAIAAFRPAPAPRPVVAPPVEDQDLGQAETPVLRVPPVRSLPRVSEARAEAAVPPRGAAPRRDAPRSDAPRAAAPRAAAPCSDAPRSDAPRSSAPLGAASPTAGLPTAGLAKVGALPPLADTSEESERPRRRIVRGTPADARRAPPERSREPHRDARVLTWSRAEEPERRPPPPVVAPRPAPVSAAPRSLEEEEEAEAQARRRERRGRTRIVRRDRIDGDEGAEPSVAVVRRRKTTARSSLHGEVRELQVDESVLADLLPTIAGEGPRPILPGAVAAAAEAAAVEAAAVEAAAAQADEDAAAEDAAAEDAAAEDAAADVAAADVAAADVAAADVAAAEDAAAEDAAAEDAAAEDAAAEDAAAEAAAAQAAAGRAAAARAARRGALDAEAEAAAFDAEFEAAFAAPAETSTETSAVHSATLLISVSADFAGDTAPATLASRARGRTARSRPQGRLSEPQVELFGGPERPPDLGWEITVDGKPLPLLILAPDIGVAADRAAAHLGKERLVRASIQLVGPSLNSVPA